MATVGLDVIVAHALLCVWTQKLDTASSPVTGPSAALWSATWRRRAGVIGHRGDQVPLGARHVLGGRAHRRALGGAERLPPGPLYSRPLSGNFADSGPILRIWAIFIQQ